MADTADYMDDVRRYAPAADEKVVGAIVKHLGIALRDPNADSAFVAGSDKSELDRVRDSWLKKKLARTEPDAELDSHISIVIDQMKGDRRKSRVTVYYLLADRLGVTDSLK